MNDTTDPSTPGGEWKCVDSRCNEENPRILVFCNKCGAARLSEWQWATENRRPVRKYFKALLAKEESTRALAEQAASFSDKAGNKSPTQETRDPSVSPDIVAETASPSQEDQTAASKSDAAGSGDEGGVDVPSEDEVEIIESNDKESSKRLPSPSLDPEVVQQVKKARYI